MSSAWPLVALGEVLELKVDAVPVDASSTYQIAGVYSFGKGLLARGPLPGTATTYKIFHRLHRDDFVLSQLKAWEGALARVTESFDGWFLSPQFPTFRAKPERLDIAYLDWYFKQSKLWEQLRSSARGMGNRRDSVSPATFLSTIIPLPPLAEQRRIVARIEGLAAKIEEALRFRNEIAIQTESLLASAYHRIADSAPRRPMSDVAPLERRPVNVDIEKIYPQVSVRSFGRGSFHKPPLVGSEVTWQKPVWVKSGDILISNIKAWEGALAVATREDDGRVASHRYLTCVPASGVASSRFVCFHLLTPEGLHYIGEASPGSADRNRTLNTKALLRIPIPVPSFEQQLWFEGLCRQVDSLKRLRIEADAELAAMLPSILDKAFRGELI